MIPEDVARELAMGAQVLSLSQAQVYSKYEQLAKESGADLQAKQPPVVIRTPRWDAQSGTIRTDKGAPTRHQRVRHHINSLAIAARESEAENSLNRGRSQRTRAETVGKYGWK